ncbi:2'-5' RNA ligase family protein [Microbispora triticiradicis]|uniref:2'-5' RNA ligase family protein n=1 Tax=Microbispora triticiradicis TaxID=2200763 RepID=UPI001AD6412F|nr:2'-5' RNA ligase family protein [Microbispora triticiradicis]MBO4270737.1 2'-5' RNA ligase family protein [Microbispora triticiradicis]
MTESDERTRDHWWWRPGWGRGRSCYAWHFLVGDQPALREFAARLRPHLEEAGVFDPVPFEWLHMTLQDVGFTDEVSDGDLTAISTAAAERVASLHPISVELGPAVVGTEGVYLPVRPAEGVAAVRRGIRESLAKVWGKDHVPETEDPFYPHVSLAYANTSGAPLAPIREALSPHAEIAPVTLTRVSLIDLNRDEGMYRWTLITAPPLGG